MDRTLLTYDTEHYFEMSRPDAERALNIYKTFGKLTDQVVQYLGTARQYESATRLEVPKLKHAPTTLTASLEEYLKDADFEINRRQYLAQQEAKRTGKPVQNISKPAPIQPTKASTTTSVTRPAPPVAKGPAPDLIDFFESIEQNQQPMAHSAPQQMQQPVNTGYVQDQQFQQFQQQPQATGYNPFLPQQPQQPQQQIQPQQPQLGLQPQYTGAGFGGYSPQPQQPYQFQSLSSIPQNGIVDFSQQQQQQQQPVAQALSPQQTSTNPFRQSVMATGTGASPATPISPQTRQNTNPFAKHNAVASPVSPMQAEPSVPASQHDLFAQNSAFFQSASPPPQQTQSPAALQPQRTGTNPFAKTTSPPPAAALAPNVTGTNPFRQSQFVNQSTGMGWQHSSQGTFGGYDLNNVPTQAVFPRPGADSN
jgi:phosphatidylinositol-binding clathrin assembly protein